MIKVIVPGKAECEFKTSDIEMVKALICLNHRPCRIESEDGTINYVFNSQEVEGDVNDLLTNGDKLVSIRMVWASNQIWAMNLHRARTF